MRRLARLFAAAAARSATGWWGETGYHWYRFGIDSVSVLPFVIRISAFAGVATAGTARTWTQHWPRERLPGAANARLDGLTVVSCPSCPTTVKPTQAAGIPFHVGDAPLLAEAEQLQDDFFGFSEIKKCYGSDVLGRVSILHINGKIRNVPLRAANDWIAFEHWGRARLSSAIQIIGALVQRRCVQLRKRRRTGKPRPP